VQFIVLLLLQNPSLDSRSAKERREAIEQMAVIGNTDAIPALASAMKKEPKSDIRSAILVALERIHDPTVVPIVAQTLRTDLDKDVRLQAIESLERFYIPIDDAGAIGSIFNRVKSVFVGPDRPVVGSEVSVDSAATEALGQAVQKDTDDDVRASAARALGSLKARDQIQALIAALRSPQNREHEDVRSEIIQSLGLIRDPAAGPVLMAALKDPSKRIVREAVTALGLIGYKEARPNLEALFNDDSSIEFMSFRISRDHGIREAALQSLAMLRDPASVPFFKSLLTASDDAYRELAAEGLGRLHYKGPELKQLYESEKKSKVQVALAFALVISGQDNYIDDIANALDSLQAEQAEAYLFELGKYEGKLADLHRFLRSPNPKVRARMVHVLGRILDPSSRELIQPLTNDPDNDVIREALAALRKYNVEAR
jgi:HEAT repeat protein